MIFSNLSDKQFEKWTKSFEPIGCLHNRHPEFLFAAVYKSKKDGTLWLSNTVRVPEGLEIRKWDQTTFIA